jgi:hypothetical protein
LAGTIPRGYRRVTACTRIIKMMFIKDGHPSALETEAIQDDVIDEDDETEVKNKAHCVIKMTTHRDLKLIRQAEAAVVKIGIYVKAHTVLA